MKTLLTTLILLISQNLVGQKVALVLSGGGAKGLAHAGAILALEENNIPIDCIAGTSMGALVGAYYASGFSAKEIVDFATSHELYNWVKNRPKKKYTYLVNNENIDPSWVSLKLSIDSSFSASFRPNLSEDVFLNFGLARKLAPATKYSEGNFDNLFVPFRATASEIFTQKDIVLKSGNLFEAARASMAVPFFYRPIKINNRLLFDGGIYNNFPVEIARYDFDPDVVIGINVASKKVNDYPYSEDESLIAESVLFAILDKTDSSELSLDDIFIDIDLKEHHALDFKEASKIIELGYQATIKKMPEIKNKISRRISNIDLSNKRKTFNQNVENIKFDDLKIRGFNKNQAKFVSGQFERIRPISFDQIEDGYNRLVSDDYFVNILPTYDFRQKSTFELYGNSNSKLKGKIGGSLISRNISQLYVGFDLKRLTKVLTHYSLGIQTGRFYQSVDFKSRIQFPGTKRFSIKPEFIYNRWNFTSTTDLFSNGFNPQIQDRYDFSYGLNLEYPVLDKLNLEIHSSIFKNKDRFSNSNTVVSSDTLDVFRLDGQKFRIRIFNNSLNFDQYAFRGQQISLYSKFIFANANYRPGSTSEIQSFRDNESNWFEVGLDFKKYFNLNKTYSLGVSSSILYSTRPVFGTSRLTILNQSSFDPLQDSKTLILQSLRGRKYLSFGMQNVFHLTNSLQLRLEGYSIYHFEQLQGNSNNSPVYFSDAELVFAGTTGLVFHTLIGPLSLSLNYYDQNENRWGALLHIGYLLFNKNSLD